MKVSLILKYWLGKLEKSLEVIIDVEKIIGKLCENFTPKQPTVLSEMNLYKQCIVISSIYLRGVCFKLFTSVIFNIYTMVCVFSL